MCVSVSVCVCVCVCLCVCSVCVCAAVVCRWGAVVAGGGVGVWCVCGVVVWWSGVWGGGGWWVCGVGLVWVCGWGGGCGEWRCVGVCVCVGSVV